MASSTDSPILIDSDNDDSDVEILREDKNEDLDIIFVSETIHVKEEEKPASNDVESEGPTGTDVGFNRSLSISSSLDVTLRLNDNPPINISALNQSPLDLSSKTEYDDISDSSGDDESLSSDDSSNSDIFDQIKGTIDSGSLLSSVPLFANSVLNSTSSLTHVHNSAVYNICSTSSTTDTCLRLLHPPSVPLVQNVILNTCSGDDKTCLSNIVSNMPLSKQSWSSGDLASTPSTSKHKAVLETDLDTSDKPTRVNFVKKTELLTRINHDTNSHRKDLVSVSEDSFSNDADKLLNDLDFLNSTQSGSSHLKLCHVLSAPSDEGSHTTGIKRTLSEHCLKSKSDDKVLPPKKQTRYLNHQSNDLSSHSSWGSEKCSHCIMSLLGLKFSRCTQGHPLCTTCLEEKVKVVLTGKAKETLRCVKAGCDSYFPLSELNRSLPKMVVDILEAKLDDDHINYIESIILKNAMSSEDSGQNVTTNEVPVEPVAKETNRPVELKTESNKDKDLPENWIPMDKKKTYELVVLEPGTTEYIDVAFKFHETMKFPIADIVKISRIQNPILWQYYNVKRSEMIQENDGIDVEERRLFHGTQSSVVECICKKGFDWRVCGKNGTLYGQGSYFAVNSSYSHQYTDKGNRRGWRTVRPRQGPFVYKPPPAHSGFQSRMISMQLLQPPPLLGPNHTFYIGPPQSSPAPSFIIGTTTPSGCILFNGPQQSTPSNGAIGQPSVIVNSQGVMNTQCYGQNTTANRQVSCGQSTSNQNGGSNVQGGYIQPTCQTSVAKTVIINSQGNNVTQNAPTFHNSQSCYGQPQVLYPPTNQNLSPGYSDMLTPVTKQEEKPTHKMILSRVLVGRFTGGNESWRKPPPLFPDEDMYGKCYDSCVDHIHEPKIFVIFDSAQAYPEYLIEYYMMND